MYIFIIYCNFQLVLLYYKLHFIALFFSILHINEVTKLNKEWVDIMERHLRLVVSHNAECNKKESLRKYLSTLKERFRCIFISKNEKIYILKDILIKIYRDYEITTGIIDEPYFIRAEKKIRRIVREKKVDYYYNLLKKFRNY